MACCVAPGTKFSTISCCTTVYLITPAHQYNCRLLMCYANHICALLRFAPKYRHAEPTSDKSPHNHSVRHICSCFNLRLFGYLIRRVLIPSSNCSLQLNDWLRTQASEPLTSISNMIGSTIPMLLFCTSRIALDGFLGLEGLGPGENKIL